MVILSYIVSCAKFTTSANEQAAFKEDGERFNLPPPVVIAYLAWLDIDCF